MSWLKTIELIIGAQLFQAGKSDPVSFYGKIDFLAILADFIDHQFDCSGTWSDNHDLLSGQKFAAQQDRFGSLDFSKEIAYFTDVFFSSAGLIIATFRPS